MNLTMISEKKGFIYSNSPSPSSGFYTCFSMIWHMFDEHVFLFVPPRIGISYKLKKEFPSPGGQSLPGNGNSLKSTINGLFPTSCVPYHSFDTTLCVSRQTVSTWHEEIRLIPISSAGSLNRAKEHIYGIFAILPVHANISTNWNSSQLFRCHSV